MVKAKIEFFEKTCAGTFETEPSIYIAENKTKDEILIQEILWQAIEIEGFDNSEVYVTVDYEEDGEYLDRDEFIMKAKVVRTDKPSRYIVWGDKKPHIFEVDKSRSEIYIEGQ